MITHGFYVTLCELNLIPMKNCELIESLKKQGFKISHDTFYRYKRLKLFTDDSSENDIKKVLRKIEKNKRSKRLSSLAKT